MVGISDVIICANFGEDRLRALGVTGGGKICHSPLTLIVALTTLSHYSECVMRPEMHLLLFY